MDSPFKHTPDTEDQKRSTIDSELAATIELTRKELLCVPFYTSPSSRQPASSAISCGYASCTEYGALIIASAFVWVGRQAASQPEQQQFRAGRMRTKSVDISRTC